MYDIPENKKNRLDWDRTAIVPMFRCAELLALPSFPSWSSGHEVESFDGEVWHNITICDQEICSWSSIGIQGTAFGVPPATGLAPFSTGYEQCFRSVSNNSNKLTIHR